jgi:tRNA-dihydrouridine synthase
VNADTRLILAPMATLTHPAFRTLVWEYGGCNLYFSEMISAEAFLGGTPFEYAYRDPRPEPGRLVYQLMGRSEEPIVEAARRLAEEPVYGIDVNMGCSAPQVAKRGGGVSWMSHPEAAARLIARLIDVAPGKAISAKFRLPAADRASGGGVGGADAEELKRFAQALELAGASFLSVHPRFRRQAYSRPARWEYVRVVKEAVEVPVYASGDVADSASFRRRARETGVDGIMIGRAAAQKPWVFADIRAAASPNTALANPAATAAAPNAGPGAEHPGWIDLPAVARRFHELLEDMLPEPFLLTRSRRFYAYFLKNLPFGNRPAAQVQQMESYEEIKAHVERYFAEHPEYRWMGRDGLGRGPSPHAAAHRQDARGREENHVGA